METGELGTNGVFVLQVVDMGSRKGAEIAIIRNPYTEESRVLEKI